MSSSSIYWYDFETFGANPQKDRVCQFAGVRTDENLNIIGDPLVIFCKPSGDFLPNPFACLITGITPRTALAKGINEFEFTRKINEEFSTPNTCVVGYNNIKFDDEFMRRLLYRNLFDPYEREYKNQIYTNLFYYLKLLTQKKNSPKYKNVLHRFMIML